MAKITSIRAREILDSRGNPTLFCEVMTDTHDRGYASIPSGASTGKHEALELRDGDPGRYGGKGVLKACDHVNGPLQKLLLGKPVEEQALIDKLMIEADGTENKSKYGANAILGVSMACARAAALVKRIPLYKYLGGIAATRIPVPMMNIINGGVHADSSLDFQEFMIRPHGFSTFSEALRAGVEVFHMLKGSLKQKGYSTAVGDEGGFAPNLSSHEEALDLISESIEKAGYKLKNEISIAMDCAASELYDEEDQLYLEKKRIARKEAGLKRTSQEQIDYLVGLAQSYAIDSIEDGLAENDWEGWKILTKKLGHIQLVGDDIFVTNPKFLKEGIKEGVANAILIKLNQIGTLTETLRTIEMALRANYKAVISHRSGETADTFIADLAVATGVGQIKTGAPSRSDRVEKYNRLLAIEAELGKAAQY
jgi:enolase